jgi:hypothetical protein
MNRRDFFQQLTGTSLAPWITRANPPTPPQLDDCPEWLRQWRLLPHHPIWESAEPLIQRLLHHLQAGSPLTVTYDGGSRPGHSRSFTPVSVFRVTEQSDAPVYVSGWCHDRQAFRTLRLDRLKLGHASKIDPSS